MSLYHAAEFEVAVGKVNCTRNIYCSPNPLIPGSFGRNKAFLKKKKVKCPLLTCAVLYTEESFFLHKAPLDSVVTLV